jgi:hypothetical protein
MAHNVLIVVTEKETIKLKKVNMLAFNEEDMLYTTLCPLVQDGAVLFSCGSVLCLLNVFHVVSSEYHID